MKSSATKCLAIVSTIFSLQFLPSIMWAENKIGMQSNNSIQSKSKNANKKQITQRILVKFKSNINPKTLSKSLSGNSTKVVKSYSLIKGLKLVELAQGADIGQTLTAYQNDPAVEFAEPDYRIELKSTFPNDSYFNQQWNMNNTGQSGGITDADINAPEAWDLTTGSDEIVVAVIDTGVDYNHPDLVNNMWRNPGELLNGLDDDGNGYIDDIYGIDPSDQDSDPSDDYVGHGTHVAGIIAAEGNNSMGIAGVSWNAKIIACKIFSNETDSVEAYVSSAVECLDYLYNLKQTSGINLIATNNSWGWAGEESQALKEAIQRHMDAGILFVAANGNDSTNADTIADQPSTINLPNIISVAAYNNQNKLADFSNNGPHTTHISAPGEDIISTFPTYQNFPGVVLEANPNTEIFFDDVENGINSWTASSTWAITQTDAYSTTSSWTDSPNGDYTNDTNSTLTSPIIDLSNVTDPDTFIGFFANYDLETMFDTVFIEASNNGGSTWTQLGNLTGEAQEWLFYQYLIPVELRTNNFKFRFHFQADEFVTYNGIFIDDIGIGYGAVSTDNSEGSYSTQSGTSMAAPHVVGAIALLKAQDPGRSWSQIKNLIVSGGKPIPLVTRPTISNRLLRLYDQNGVGSLACNDQSVQRRLFPLTDNYYYDKNVLSINVSMLNINCAEPAGEVSINVLSNNNVVQNIILQDNGQGFDRYQGDGVYSAQLNTNTIKETEFKLQFPGGNVVSVKQGKNYAAAEETQYIWRNISRNEKIINISDETTNIITAPFLVSLLTPENRYNKVSVSDNGYLALHNDLNNEKRIEQSSLNSSLPTLRANNMIAPYWSDLVNTVNSKLSYGTIGVAPNREFVIQWTNFQYYFLSGISQDNGVTFQVVFFENSSDIVFNYQDVIFGEDIIDSGAIATIGVQTHPTIAQTHSIHRKSIRNAFALQWSEFPSTGSKTQGGGGGAIDFALLFSFLLLIKLRRQREYNSVCTF